MIAEKPSVARDLARALGVTPKGKTHFESDRYVITWCIGHLVELDEPESYDPAWKAWRLDALPMIPPRFRLRASTFAPEQYRAVRELLRDSGRFAEVINACDAGREGELIFRYVYEHARSALPIRRLWVSSLTDEAISRGFSKLEAGSKYDRLADAARSRSEADWLVGLNATRAITARARTGGDRTLYSLGRVQTPTLALVVQRDDAINNFVPKDYWQVNGTFATAKGQRFNALWTHATGARLATDALANALCGRCKSANDKGPPSAPVVETVTTKRTREAPPLLFDLTSLQRTANKRFGFSAQRTLEIAQALYEKHKVLTYPRTDSRHLPRDAHGELPGIFNGLAAIADYQGFVRAIPSPAPMPRRMFDDAQVSDHHAIIPTSKKCSIDALGPDEKKIYDLVARRFIAGFFADAEFDDTTVVVRVGGGSADGAPSFERKKPSAESASKESKDEPVILRELPAPPDRFVTRGRVRINAGWQEVAGIDDERSTAPRPTAQRDDAGEQEDEDPQQSLPRLTQGEVLEGRFEPKKKQTRPPPRYSEATLLSAMEFAGKSLEDEALRAAMRERGLGTPATRAATIEKLIERGYIRRDRRNVLSTPLGAAVIHGLPVSELASPELTGNWEARLARIEKGEESREAFMKDIAEFVRSSVNTVKSAPFSVPVSETSATARVIAKCPRCGNSVVDRTGDYACAVGASPCGLSIPKKIAQRDVSPELAAVLLRAKKTMVLRGFRSRAGKRFNAALELRDDGTVAFVFESGAQGSASEAEPPRPAPLRRERSAMSAERDRASEPAKPKPVATYVSAPKKPKSEEALERDALKREAEQETLDRLTCPRCKSGRMIAGKRGWGCARWKDGCTFVVWFETAGRKLTIGQLEQLVGKGKTRSGLFRPGNGPPTKGRLVLDVDGKEGGARFEASETE